MFQVTSLSVLGQGEHQLKVLCVLVAEQTVAQVSVSAGCIAHTFVAALPELVEECSLSVPVVGQVTRFGLCLLWSKIILCWVQEFTRQELCLGMGYRMHHAMVLYWDQRWSGTWGTNGLHSQCATGSVRSWDAGFGLQLRGTVWEVCVVCSHCKNLGPTSWHHAAHC